MASLRYQIALPGSLRMCVLHTPILDQVLRILLICGWKDVCWESWWFRRRDGFPGFSDLPHGEPKPAMTDFTLAQVMPRWGLGGSHRQWQPRETLRARGVNEARYRAPSPAAYRTCPYLLGASRSGGSQCSVGLGRACVVRISSEVLGWRGIVPGQYPPVLIEAIHAQDDLPCSCSCSSTTILHRVSSPSSLLKPPSAASWTVASVCYINLHRAPLCDGKMRETATSSASLPTLSARIWSSYTSRQSS